MFCTNFGKFGKSFDNKQAEWSWKIIDLSLKITYL